MKVSVPTGKYIVAVSGGVDSVVLLDILSKQQDLELVVAHFDHGIREDSADDRQFVESLAKKYGLVFEYAEGKLGKQASEEAARKVRYEFLRSMKDKHQATAIITAHHQDDVLETILINLLRGTKRRGLSSLQSTNEILRPLLSVGKSEIKKYAADNKLHWHEDSTNQDPKYLRNWVRLNLMPKLTATQKQALLETNQKAGELNKELDSILQDNFHTEETELNKSAIVNSPHDVACEVIADWLRQNDIREFDRPTIERLVIGAKTLRPGKAVEIKKDIKMLVGEARLKILR